MLGEPGREGKRRREEYGEAGWGGRDGRYRRRTSPDPHYPDRHHPDRHHPDRHYPDRDVRRRRAPSPERDADDDGRPTLRDVLRQHPELSIPEAIGLLKAEQQRYLARAGGPPAPSAPSAPPARPAPLAPPSSAPIMPPVPESVGNPLGFGQGLGHPGLPRKAAPVPAPALPPPAPRSIGAPAPAPAPAPLDAATKAARELYIGGIPKDVTGAIMQKAIATAMVHMGIVASDDEDPTVRSWIGSDGRYAFVQFRDEELVRPAPAVPPAPPWPALPSPLPPTHALEPAAARMPDAAAGMKHPCDIHVYSVPSNKLGWLQSLGLRVGLRGAYSSRVRLPPPFSLRPPPSSRSSGPAAADADASSPRSPSAPSPAPRADDQGARAERHDARRVGAAHQPAEELRGAQRSAHRHAADAAQPGGAAAAAA